MPFLQSIIGYIRGIRADPTVDEAALKRAAEDAWGLVQADRTPLPAGSGGYDWMQWRKKLQRVLDGLPATEPEWAGMMTEARALGFGEEAVLGAQIEEFTLLVRRAVADCELSTDEHAKLAAAKRLIGLSHEEAEELVKTVIREAEAFFGHQVRQI